MNPDLIVFQTERLILREFELTDEDLIFRLLNSSSWQKFLGNRGINSLADAGKYISDKLINSYKKYGFGLYLIQLKNGNESIGMCGLVKREFLECADIGFALLPEFSGKGYAYEASLATMDYCRSVLKINKLAGITSKDNYRSIRLLEKLEMKFEKYIRIDTENKDLMLYEKEL